MGNDGIFYKHLAARLREHNQVERMFRMKYDYCRDFDVGEETNTTITRMQIANMNKPRCSCCYSTKNP
jgi:hypothetical protein